ncbi:MAG: GH92 family glycosyl hydrolase [Bacteroidales bacterium]|nr:GH92 family glycosyl hydrolase [Bacteroidales bacterium]
MLITGCQPHPVQKEAVDYVDPFLGTSNCRWMLFPGPTMPFGMVKLSPDNTDEWLMDAGYEYTIESISGFGHVHSWMMGSFLCMPTTGEIKTAPGTKEDPDSGYRSRIDHANEKASPGYYSVLLNDYDIKAELTATTRGGFHRYTYPETDSAHVLFDLQVPEEAKPEIIHASVHKVSDTEIAGTIHRVAGWNEYKLHFVSRFNRPFETMDGWKGDSIKRNIEEISVHDNSDIGALVNFSAKTDQEVLMKTGISYVSIDQARLNMEREMDQFGWEFDKVYENARTTWNSLLSKIKVEGGTEEEKVKFYTNLYRAYSARTIFSDVDGKYTDMCEKTQQLDDPDSPVYGCDAFWNTFWNLNQLWSLVNPDMAEKWINSLLEIYDAGGWLPKGPGGLEYSSIMVASHEIPLIVNAWQKGIKGFDEEKAYRAMKEIQTTPARAHECGGYVGNRNLLSYVNKGFVPADEGPVSNTLEYAYDDWCVAQMAKSLGKEDDYVYFMNRSQYYRNVFDKQSGYMRPKERGGPWSQEFEPVVKAVGKEDSFGGKDYVEGNAWQYSWFVPHDVPGLIDLMGVGEFNSRLEAGFEDSKPRFVSQFVNHSNQPNMQAAWLFNYSGKPWLTQKWVRAILENYYGTGPVDGYPGDEDQGQMGAWYVMSAMGLFEMDGGASLLPVYEIASPVFNRVTIQLDENYYKGKEFIIEARNTSKANKYIQSATLNGKSHDSYWFYHSELVKGGKLVLEMGPEPNMNWAADTEPPHTYELEPPITPPYVTNPEKQFLEKAVVSIECDTDGTDIYYSLDGEEPDKCAKLFTGPFTIHQTTTINMIAFRGDQASLPATAEFKKTLFRQPVEPGPVKAGLRYNYYSGAFRMVNDFANLEPLKSGITSNLTIGARESETYFAFDFEGYMKIPQDGLYTFYLKTNDGSKMYLAEEPIIDNDGLHPAIERKKTMALKKGTYPIVVKYFQEGGTNLLKVSWKGPGVEKQEIPGSVLFHK